MSQLGATRFNQQAVVTGGELGENGDYRDEVLLFTLKGRLDSSGCDRWTKKSERPQ